MRFLVVDTYYPPFLAEHYSAPGLAERPYAEQLDSLYARCFGTSDSYSWHLRSLGHEATDLVVNCEPLQLAWAKENSALPSPSVAMRRLPGPAGRWSRQRLLHRIAAAQIRSLEPDVLYVQDLWFFTQEELDELRGRGILVVGQIASPAPPDEVLRGFDLILTSFPHWVERFRKLGVDSEYLKIAFEERVLDRLRTRGVDTDPRAARPHDVSFVGGVDPGVHAQRVDLLERVCEAADLEVWGYGADALPASSPIRARYRGEAWGLDMYGILAGSRIVINRHIDAAEGHANNMRLYEATGAGALVITDNGTNLPELFTPGEELVTYDGPDELLERVVHYLRNDDERAKVAAAGQARTLREHTYEQRIAELAAILERRLAAPRA